MASVLLLYYHLLREGGITNDQTVYIDPDAFNPFMYLTVEVEMGLTDVDQDMLREGAAIHLLCDLNDIVSEYESDYLKQPHAKKILAAFAAQKAAAVPEAAAIAKLILAGERSLNYQELSLLLSRVYEQYVVRRMQALVAPR